MSEEWQECEHCQSENIERVIAVIGHRVDKSKYQNKTGDLVKSHIEEARSEVKERKRKLRSKVYKDD